MCFLRLWSVPRIAQFVISTGLEVDPHTFANLPDIPRACPMLSDLTILRPESGNERTLALVFLQENRHAKALCDGCTIYGTCPHHSSRGASCRGLARHHASTGTDCSPG